MVELQNEDKLNEIIDKKIGDEIDGSTISDVFEGYKFINYYFKISKIYLFKTQK